MTSKITADEMHKVLLEFHQRNQGLIRPPGPPPPFEITSSVVQQKPLLYPPRRQDNPPPEEQSKALIKPETEFDFIPNNYTFSGTILQCYLDWFFRCHNEGTLGFESYIRLHPGSFWRSVNPPGYSGSLGFAFRPSTWTPPASNEQGALVNLTISLYGVPNPSLYPITEAHMYFAAYIETVQTHQISERIFAPYEIFAWHWYGANNGIGFDLVFHTPGP